MKHPVWLSFAAMAATALSCGAPRPGAAADRAPLAPRAPSPVVTLRPGPVDVEPALDVIPAVKLVEPPEGAVMSLEGAARSPVVVQAPPELSRLPGARIALVLDGGPVHFAQAGAALTLGDTMLEDRVLEPGEHVLAAVVCDRHDRVARGRDGSPSVSVRRFWVGEPRGAPAAGPVLVSIQPGGTYNGEASARAMVVDYVVHPPLQPNTPVHLTIVGPAGETAVALHGPWPVHVRGVGNGDHRFVLELPAAGASRCARTERVVTVNLEL